MPADRLTTSVVIATRNRPDYLRATLESLARQSQLPDEVIVVDSSDIDRAGMVRAVAENPFPFRVRHLRTERPSAARQRNLGGEVAQGELVFFIDDDVILDSEFLEEICGVFELDEDHQVGGISGTMVNNSVVPLSLWNRLALRLTLGPLPDSLAGRLIGPAVNFLPEDRPNTVQEVEWLPSGCSAYRREVFLAHRFPEHFEGYSFAEDVHLSARVAKTHRLLNTTRARLYHHDTGRETHRDWRALGESMVRHRHEIMTEILGRRSAVDHWRLFAYEILYCTLAWLAGVRPVKPRRLFALLRGKFDAFYAIWREAGERPRE